MVKIFFKEIKINRFKISRQLYIPGLMIILMLMFLLASTHLYALGTTDTGYQVPSSTTVTIDAHGVCKKVVNSSTANDYFVPTRTAAEWQSFIDHPPSGVSFSSCGSPFSGLVLVDEQFLGFSAWDPNPNNDSILVSTAQFDATSWNKFGTATTINGVDYAAGHTKPWTWSMGTSNEVRLKDQAKYFIADNHFADNDLKSGYGASGNVVRVASNSQVKLTFTPTITDDYVLSFNYNPSVGLVYNFNDDGSQNTQPPALFTTDIYTVKMETGGVTTTLVNIKPQDLFQNSADYSVFYDTHYTQRRYITTGTGSYIWHWGRTKLSC